MEIYQNQPQNFNIREVHNKFVNHRLRNVTLKYAPAPNCVKQKYYTIKK